LADEGAATGEVHEGMFGTICFRHRNPGNRFIPTPARSL
jgi:hypothetical protein